MKVVFTCGGTGGHIFPAISIAKELRNKFKNKVDILFIGSDYGMEKEIINKNNFKYNSITARPFIRKLTYKNFINLIFILKAINNSKKILKTFNPDIIIGTGGFVSFPVIVAGIFLKKKTLIHEPNITPGIANKLLSKFVTFITVGFEETKKYFPENKTYVTGNPIRKSLFNKNKIKGYKMFNLAYNKKTILIMPGSRAAKKINEVMLETLPILEKNLKNIQIIWMCGKESYAKIKNEIKKYKKIKIKLYKFIYNTEYAYNIADIGILRAGASTLSEIIAINLPSILIPYPYATDNHQEKNASVLEKNNCAIVIKDKDLTSRKLFLGIKNLLNERMYMNMKKRLKNFYSGNGVDNIIKLLEGVLINE